MLIWGTYDTTKPRVQLLLAGVRQVADDTREIHVPIWADVRDKGTLTAGEQLRASGRWIAAIPGLLWRYMRAPAHDVVLVPYLGLFDVIALWPLARLRGATIAWDVFISPYDTIVHDRRQRGAGHPLARFLYAMEWIAARLADLPFLDTPTHARRFEELMGLPRGHVGSVPLGTDPGRFTPRPPAPPVRSPFQVLFYGQYIPLHGLETVVRAAAVVESHGVTVDWLLVGAGQERARVTALIDTLGVHSIRQLGWVAAAELPRLIHQSAVGLGIFGTSPKALAVVPNKLYELAATQTPIVTGDTPAAREFARGHPWIHLVPPGDPQALAACVERLASGGDRAPAGPMPVVGPRDVGEAFLRFVARA